MEHLGTETISLDKYIEDLEALRIALKRDKLSLLGHSWGAMLAAAYAVRYPDKVEELVLVDSGPLAMEWFGLMGDVLTFRRNLLNVQGELKEDQELFELRPFFFDQRKAVEFARRDRSGEVATPTSKWLIPDLQRVKFDLRPSLGRLRCRTLIIQGRHDAMPESLVLETASRIPGSKVVFIERAGHFSWIEQPKAFFEALRPFLQAR